MNEKKRPGRRMKPPALRTSRLCACLLILLLSAFLVLTVSADVVDVAGAIEHTWSAAKVQIKQVVNNVVFPVLDLILAVLFFAKVGLSYLDYRRNGRLDFTAPAILFATLLFTLTAPAYLWSIIGP